jgi:hypothetical protein
MQSDGLDPFRKDIFRRVINLALVDQWFGEALPAAHAIPV